MLRYTVLADLSFILTSCLPSGALWIPTLKNWEYKSFEKPWLGSRKP
ncbi:MAG TPA: hypothetical protein VEV17_20535 [Bryobacteraceae bacterium]|nr:hypothetical protein [Bryobacteraceae bacterium]